MRYRLSPPYHIPDPTKDWLLAKKQHVDQYEQLMILAACCLGFFAFMGSGELTTTDNTAFDPTLHLTPMDIVVNNTSNTSTLKSLVKLFRNTDKAGYRHLLGKDI